MNCNVRWTAHRFNWLENCRKIFLKVAGGQENWFKQVLQYLGNRLVSESITRHPNKTSPLRYSVCLAPRIGNGTPRTREVNGVQRRTTELTSLADWCTVKQETSRYSSGCSPYSCLCALFGLATSRCKNTSSH